MWTLQKLMEESPWPGRLLLTGKARSHGPRDSGPSLPAVRYAPRSTHVRSLRCGAYFTGVRRRTRVARPTSHPFASLTKTPSASAPFISGSLTSVRAPTLANRRFAQSHPLSVLATNACYNPIGGRHHTELPHHVPVLVDLPLDDPGRGDALAVLGVGVGGHHRDERVHAMLAARVVDPLNLLHCFG